MCAPPSLKSWIRPCRAQPNQKLQMSLWFVELKKTSFYKQKMWSVMTAFIVQEYECYLFFPYLSFASLTKSKFIDVTVVCGTEKKKFCKQKMWSVMTGFFHCIRIWVLSPPPLFFAFYWYCRTVDYQGLAFSILTVIFYTLSHHITDNKGSLLFEEIISTNFLLKLVKSRHIIAP